MHTICICHRHAEGAALAARLRQALIEQGGSALVFIDATGPRSGPAATLVLLLTRGYFDPPDRPDPDLDEARQRLETALARHEPVLVLLADGASMPRAADLPSGLRRLAALQALPLRSEHWRGDVEAIGKALRSIERASRTEAFGSATATATATASSTTAARPVRDGEPTRPMAPARGGPGILARLRNSVGGLFARKQAEPPAAATPPRPAVARSAPPAAGAEWRQPRESMREAMPEAAGAEPPSPIDATATPVWFGAAAPKRSAPAQSFTARLVVYSDAARASAQAKLEALGEADDRLLTDIAPDGDARWRIGAPVCVALSGQHLVVTPPQRNFIWNGRENLAAFSVSVASGAPAGRTTLTFQVLLAGLPMAYLPLSLEITAASAAQPVAEPAVAAPASAAPRSAFASYSSRDAPEVTGRLSSLQRWAPTLAIFQDCLDLQPNEAFKPQLERQITERDVFLLFWSRNAAASKWVNWEYETARKAKGLDAIVAMPLEDPAIVPPPPEFAEAHMRDRFMMARYALQEIREQANAALPSPGGAG